MSTPDIRGIRKYIGQNEHAGSEEKVTPPLLWPDEAYGAVVRDVIMTGTVVPPEKERTGTGVIKQFGVCYRVDVGRTGLPVLTTKEVNIQSVLAEYLWFLSGDPNINELQKYTSIWDEWADDNGKVETSYGRMWRSFPAFPLFNVSEGEAHATIKEYEKTKGGMEDVAGVDQIRRVMKNIQENPHSRRHHVTAWHPANALASRLPPCHHSFTFYVDGERLHMELHQRSGDLALGVPFNMAGYGFILKMMAHSTGLEPGILKHNITDAHIYLNHIEKLAEQIQRTPTALAPHAVAEIELSNPELTIADLDLSNLDDIEVEGYRSRNPVRYEVAV
jgi:thymidylate synthase